MWYAWFSAKASKIGGTSFYKRADGTEVEVTLVTKNANPDYGFDDKQYLGEVESFSRAGIKSIHHYNYMKLS